MSKKITIIGGGPGGYIAALRAAQLGADVTLIEHDNIGGTCLNWGCIPSKVMKNAAESAVMIRKAGSMGIEIDGTVSVDLNAIYDRKEKVVKSQRDGIMKLLSRQRVKYINGFATITEPNLCVVRHSNGDSLQVPWEKLILAVGSSSLDLPSLHVDHDHILSSNDFFNLEKIPKSIMIIGGGVIGCEFAIILKSFGSDVTIIEALPRLLPLPSVDEDCSKVLQREMKKRKIRLLVNRTVDGMEEKDGKILVKTIPSVPDTDLKQKEGGTQELEVEKVMVCIGRKPNTSGIGLENAPDIADQPFHPAIFKGGVDIHGQLWGPLRARFFKKIKEGFINRSGIELKHHHRQGGRITGTSLEGPVLVDLERDSGQGKGSGFNTGFGKKRQGHDPLFNAVNCCSDAVFIGERNFFGNHRLAQDHVAGICQGIGEQVVVLGNLGFDEVNVKGHHRGTGFGQERRQAGVDGAGPFVGVVGQTQLVRRCLVNADHHYIRRGIALSPQPEQ